MEAKFARTLLAALGRPDLTEAACGPSGPGQEPAKAFLRDAFARETRAEREAWMQGKDVCFAPALDLHEAWAQPQVAAREMLLRDERENLRIGTPLRFAEQPARPDLRRPGLGEHGAAIRAELIPRAPSAPPDAGAARS